MSDLSLPSFGSVPSCNGDCDIDCSDCDCDCDCPDCDCDCDCPDCDCDCDCSCCAKCCDNVSNAISGLCRCMAEGFENYVCCCFFQASTTDIHQSHDYDEHHSTGYHHGPPIAPITCAQPWAIETHAGGKTQTHNKQARKDPSKKTDKKQGDGSLSGEELEYMVMEKEPWHPSTENNNLMTEDSPQTLQTEEIKVVMAATEISATFQSDSEASQHNEEAASQINYPDPETNDGKQTPLGEINEETSAEINDDYTGLKTVNLEPLPLSDDEPIKHISNENTIVSEEEDCLQTGTRDECETVTDTNYPEVAPPNYDDVVTDQPVSREEVL